MSTASSHEETLFRTNKTILRELHYQSGRQGISAMGQITQRRNLDRSLRPFLILDRQNRESFSDPNAQELQARTRLQLLAV